MLRSSRITMISIVSGACRCTWASTRANGGRPRSVWASQFTSSRSIPARCDFVVARKYSDSSSVVLPLAFAPNTSTGPLGSFTSSCL
ncbi:MAG: hypothetical protein WKH64_14260 [Chloroflexia bacterium]